jgi:hypothetical protein
MSSSQLFKYVTPYYMYYCNVKVLPILLKITTFAISYYENLCKYSVVFNFCIKLL